MAVFRHILLKKFSVLIKDQNFDRLKVRKLVCEDCEDREGCENREDRDDLEDRKLLVNFRLDTFRYLIFGKTRKCSAENFKTTQSEKLWSLIKREFRIFGALIFEEISE